MSLQSTVIFFALGIVALLGVAWCETACGAPLAAQAEATYGAELQACTATAKLADAGRAGSKACEAEVDRRWHVTTDGGGQ